MPILDRIAALHDGTAAWRRHLHRNPEPGFEEHATAAFVAGKLRGFGADEVHAGIAVTGVAGVVRSGSGRRSVGLRADTDALPIHEATGLPHASKAPGRMHARGHDGHTAMLLGAARYLAGTRKFDGTVYLIFQPAEEVGGGNSGGRRTLDEGLLARFPAERVFGLHDSPRVPLGRFVVREGFATAAMDDFRITIEGRGGHAAHPHLGRDPIAVGRQVAQALQSLAARELDPLDSASVAVTRFSAGDTRDTIPRTAELEGTVRTFEPDTRAPIERRVRQIVGGAGTLGDATLRLDYRHGCPAAVNAAREAALGGEAAADVAGEAEVDRVRPPITAAEAFAFMLQARPGAVVHVGIGAAEQGKGLHRPHFDFNDAALPYGASYWVRLAERSLARPSAAPGGAP